MDIPPRFTDQQIGLEMPPEAVSEPVGAPTGLPETPVAVSVVVCPNCGCKDPVVQMVDDASVATCPECQCEFDGNPGGADIGSSIPMESGISRILGKTFENLVRRQHHALKQKQRRTVSQHQPKLPGQ